MLKRAQRIRRVRSPSAASPGQVARVYLRAARTGNCTVTAALTLSQTWSWCDDPKLLDYRPVQSRSGVPASEAGRNEQYDQGQG